MIGEQAVLNMQYEAAVQAMNAEEARRTPHVLMRPTISIDGNKWCALYGENLQDGVAGFGDTPAEAMADFDKAWNAKLTRDGVSTDEGDGN